MKGTFWGSVVGVSSGRATDEARARKHAKVRGSWAKNSRMGERDDHPSASSSWRRMGRGQTPLIYPQGREREGGSISIREGMGGRLLGVGGILLRGTQQAGAERAGWGLGRCACVRVCVFAALILLGVQFCYFGAGVGAGVCGGACVRGAAGAQQQRGRREGGRERGRGRRPEGRHGRTRAGYHPSQQRFFERESRAGDERERLDK